MREEESSGSGFPWLLGGGIIALTMQQTFFAAFIGALLGYAVGKVLQLQSVTQRLAVRLRLLELQRAAAARSEPVPATVGLTPPQPRIPETQPEQEPAAPPTPESMTEWREPAADVVAAAAATPARVAPPSWLDTAFNSFIDWFRNGNPLARAGIVVLFFGSAFLAKYAAEHSQFPIELRFIVIAIVALGLLGFGWRLRDSRSGYAQTLQGGGIAGLYLTVFAATKLYALLPPGTALILMVLVAIAAAILAVAQDALALAVIGSAGGFLAPILVSTGSANHIALFSYYTVLNFGIFAIAWFRAWRVLNLIGLLFTFGIAGAFRATAYTPDKMISTDFFVGLFFLLYVGVSILFSLRQKPALRGYVSSSLVFGLPLAAFGIHASLVSGIEHAVACSAFGLGSFYLALAWIILRTRLQNLQLLGEAFIALGIIFVSLAIPLAFDAQTTSATWALEGAGLLWMGLRQQRRLARAFGILLQILAGLAFVRGLYAPQALEHLPPVLNSITLGCCMLAVAGLLSGLWLFRNTAANAAHEENWDHAATIWGTAWWLFGLLGEIQRSLPHDKAAGMMVALTLTALAWHLKGSWLQWPLPRVIALWLIPPAALIGLSAAESAHPLAHALAWTWPLLFAVQYALLWREDVAQGADAKPAHGGFHVAALWLFALLAAWEIQWRIERVSDGIWADLPWGLIPAMLLALLTPRPLLPAWPFAHHDASYRSVAGSGLAAVALCWIFLVNLGNPGDPAPLPYLPLLNPLDLGVLSVLALVAGWWRALGEHDQPRIGTATSALLRGAFAALIFLWLNASLLRALHYLADAPLDFSSAMHSFLVQAALSVLWSLLGFGAMTLAARRAQRELWMLGAALMAIVVAKLFLVDLSGTGTLARIVSFLIVGGLLVITGYVSPLPPHRDDKRS